MAYNEASRSLRAPSGRRIQKGGAGAAAWRAGFLPSRLRRSRSLRVGSRPHAGMLNCPGTIWE